MVSCSLLSVVAWASVALAKTVTYDFEIGWVKANPDGQFERDTVGINGKWPIPTIEVVKGDRLIVNVVNKLGDRPTSLHFHGMFQNGTTHMDGPALVTQCAIPVGGKLTYDFVVDQPGTYWYHSHTKGQYPDGLRGPFIVHDDEFPYADDVDEEIVITFSDWYHSQMKPLMDHFMSKENPTGAEPIPDSALMNDTQDLQVKVEPGKTYHIRMVNMGAFAGQHVWFEGHTVRIIEVDGVYTKEAEADMIYLTAAQRVSVLLTAKENSDGNFPIVASMDTDLFDGFDIADPETWNGLNWNVTGWLVYDSEKDLPKPKVLFELDPYDDTKLVPYDEMSLLPPADTTITLDVIMDNLGDGANYAWFNNITYKHAKVPTLYTALTTGDLATNPLVYGHHTNTHVLNKGDVVDIVVNNLDPGRHPFHLHGHHFQVVHRSDEEAGAFGDSGVQESDFPKVPMRRDTVVIWPNGNLVLRFVADNPGVWLFHCHIEWHVVSGLIATMVEAPLELQKTLELPQDHLDACKADGIPIKGNAAGNTVDLLNLDGEPAPPKPLPEGFTARGIVALVFTVICALLGIATVAWYGMSNPGDSTVPVGVKRRVEAADLDGAAEENTAVPGEPVTVGAGGGSGGAIA